MSLNAHSATLANLLAGIVFIDPIFDRVIQHITTDSRDVKENTLFIAYRGQSVDGRDFIVDAIKGGAIAILAEGESHDASVDLQDTIPIFKSTAVRELISKIAARFYGHASRQMCITGITGTNGKTSVSHFIARAKASLGIPCAVMGTVGYGLLGALHTSTHTTPDPIFIQNQLQFWLDQGIKDVAMEVSSHALDQSRVKAIEFNTAVFTNLTRDHLDYHTDMMSYGLAKQRLFEQFALKVAVLNNDDPFSETLRATCEGRVKIFTYGLKASADCYAVNIQTHPQGLKFFCHTPWGEADLTVPVYGAFNVLNILAVITVLLSEGHPFEAVIDACKQLEGVPGRMQVLHRARVPTVVIDYAHTPDALVKALEATRAHSQGKIWCVFGCGGDRDPGKRPLMAAAVEQAADHIIVTDDNPRMEDPKLIVNDIMKGFLLKKPSVIEHDREKAILFAMSHAGCDDTILVAGKGHEDYQIIGREKAPFSDKEVVLRLQEQCITK